MKYDIYYYAFFFYSLIYLYFIQLGNLDAQIKTVFLFNTLRKLQYVFYFIQSNSK